MQVYPAGIHQGEKGFPPQAMETGNEGLYALGKELTREIMKKVITHP